VKNSRSILPSILIWVITFLFIGQLNPFLEYGCTSENFLEREIEESIKEGNKTDLFERHFTGDGGNDLQATQVAKCQFPDFSTLIKQRLSIYSRVSTSQSLVILYCCLKIAIC